MKQTASKHLTGKRSSEAGTSSVEEKKKKRNKPTSSDLFGDGSGEEEESIPLPSKGKKVPPIYTQYTRRVANGISRQCIESKMGAYYVELKIYDVSEIERVLPINRWRHAVVSLKNRTDDNTPAWAYLKKFLNETKKEFKGCPHDFVSSYY